jgi:hypothetical protein
MLLEERNMKKFTKSELYDLTLDFTECLIDNKPGSVKRAPDCKCTYNGKQAPLGSGDIWGLPRRIPFRQTFVDPETGNICFFGILTNMIHYGLKAMGEYSNGDQIQQWWIYMLRLKAGENGFVEIEEISRHETPAVFGVLPQDIKPDRLFETPLADDEKCSREEMINIAAKYWDANQHTIPVENVPIHPDARRMEIGTYVTDEMNFPASLKKSFEMPEFFWQVVKRRYPVVDVDRGLVISIVSMLSKHDKYDMPSGYVTDLFKIQSGRIKHVFAFHCHQIEYVDWEGEGPQESY